MKNALEELRQYIRISNQENLEPRNCFKRHPTTLPTLCRRYREGISNGEPEGACCNGCPIADFKYCPDVESDTLSMSALDFTTWYDHPAHKDYKNLLWNSIGPVISPSEIIPWLQRRQTIWEMYQIISHEIEAKQREEANKALNSQ